MLFNSYEFILCFLPVVFAGYFLIGRKSQPAAAAWLAAASLFFYGWWSIRVVPLLLASIITNYWLGQRLVPDQQRPAAQRKRLLVVALTLNLALLAFFKYTNFLIGNVNALLSAVHQPPVPAADIILPIGISFYTFTQIAFLVDCWQGKVKERNFTHYLLFVTYFPHLIAGPVLHHAQMMPQFATPSTYRLNFDKIAIGVVIFTIGLAKKLLIADPAGDYANVLFAYADAGRTPMFLMSWIGVLAYAIEIYFDFSGYSDMAIGLSLLFGIRLPINFNAPYKSLNIVDFWRRWHISLSTFLRDYLYIPLGGNKYGVTRRYLNLFTTMLLGGLWHGANWTFVLWGAAHGAFLIVNHGWQRLVGADRQYGPLGRAACWLLTFLAVCFAWVLFRADSVTTAHAIYRGMLGLNGFSLPPGALAALGASAAAIGATPDGVWQDAAVPSIAFHYSLVLSLGMVIALACRSSTQIQAGLTERLAQPPATLPWRLLAGVSLLFCVSMLFISKHSQFLYFQF